MGAWQEDNLRLSQRFETSSPIAICHCPNFQHSRSKIKESDLSIRDQKTTFLIFFCLYPSLA